MKKNNTCQVCGKPCKSKFCKEHAKAAYRRNYKRKTIKFNGCDEDCAHCPYPDCLKPAYQIKSDDNFISKKEKDDLTSQQKMYTLCLGGYGGARPNTSKKFYA
jgi:hypothetical protein